MKSFMNLSRREFDKVKMRFRAARTISLAAIALGTTLPLAAAFVASTPGTAAAYVSGCTLSRNWENLGGATVTNSSSGCGYPAYGYFYATYSSPATYQAGFWYDTTHSRWVEGTSGYQYVANSTTADVLEITACYPCSMYSESAVGSSAWVTEEY
jgi:fructose-specific phosphotransferase system IIC component